MHLAAVERRLGRPGIAFGLCDLGIGLPEMGYVRISEIRATRGRLGLPPERDLYIELDKTLTEYWRGGGGEGYGSSLTATPRPSGGLAPLADDAGVAHDLVQPLRRHRRRRRLAISMEPAPVSLWRPNSRFQRPLRPRPFPAAHPLDPRQVADAEILLPRPPLRASVVRFRARVAE